MAYRNSFKQAVRDSKRLIVSIRQRSRQASTDLIHLRRESEGLKIAVLLCGLEEEKAALLRSRGVQSLLKGEDRRVTWVNFILGSTFGWLETHHGLGALAQGVDSSARLQESREGKVQYAVELGRQIRVITVSPGEPLPPGRWVNWESLTRAALELGERGLRGEELGDLNSIISTLQQEGHLLYYASIIRRAG